VSTTNLCRCGRPVLCYWRGRLMCDVCFRQATRSPPASEPAEDEHEEAQWCDECWCVVEELETDLEDES
jgi:hypothetical protein